MSKRESFFNPQYSIDGKNFINCIIRPSGYLFAWILIVIALLMFVISPVSGTDVTYWDSHYVPSGTGGPVAGSPPNGIEYLYIDSPEISGPTLQTMCDELKTTCYNGWPYFRVNSQGANIGAIDYAQPGLVFTIDGPVISGQYVTGLSTTSYTALTGGYDGYALQNYIWVGSGTMAAYGPMYVYINELTPIVSSFDFTPSNPTIDDTIQFISLSTPKNKIDYYFWEVRDENNKLRASALNMDEFTYKGLSEGDYNVTLTVGNTSDIIYSSFSKNMYVSSGIEVINRVNVKDASTNSAISGCAIQAYNQDTDYWTNTTYSQLGTLLFSANQSDIIDIYAQADNYIDGERLNYITPDTGGTINLLLYPDIGAPSNGTLSNIQFIIRDADSYDGIASAKVSVTYGGNSASAYTNNDGYTSFAVDNSSTLFVKVEKSGYNTISKYLNIISQSSADEILMSKILIAPTPTYTIPIPTLPSGGPVGGVGGYNPVTGEYEPYYNPDTGVYVTPTFVGGWSTGGMGGESEFTEYTCIKPPYPTSWGYMDIILNGIACNGVKGATNQKLILSLVIIGCLALILSRYAKGTGALAGAIIGSAVCIGMGLLPIWIAILMIVCCGIIIAKMISGGN